MQTLDLFLMRMRTNLRTSIHYRVPFLSRTLQTNEHRFPIIKKEATAVKQAVRKRAPLHLLVPQHFTLATEHILVAFTLDNRKHSKIKHYKIHY